MQSNQCQLFEPHEPLVILVEYDMCSLLQFPNTSGYDNEDDEYTDYSYPDVANTLNEMYNKLISKYGENDYSVDLESGNLVDYYETMSINVKGSNWFNYLSNVQVLGYEDFDPEHICNITEVMINSSRVTFVETILDENGEFGGMRYLELELEDGRFHYGD